MTDRLEAGPAPRLGLISIHGEGRVAVPARVRHMMRHAAQRPPGPAVIDVEHQGRLCGQGRMQRLRRVPRLEPHARHILALRPGLAERHRHAVDREHEPLRLPAGDPHL